MGIKIENVEDRQLPRWVYAMMKAKMNPEDEVVDDDGPKRFLAQQKAVEFYNNRQERLKALEDANATSRYSGLEWKSRPKTTFTSDELDKIIPTRRLSYVVKRTIFISFVSLCVIAATLFTCFVGLAVCAEIKLNVSAGEAWRQFIDSPVGYYYHVMNAFEWTLH